ncbi:MAG: nicotinate phosphoribosyltransferase [Bacilli bacterium]|nr:nicotinate phosphoribosyltransferase [Bacilli bacterium]
MKELEITLKEKGKIKRLTNKTFKFPKEIATGFYSANYFLKTRKIVASKLKNHTVTMQFFQRSNDVMLCGIDEVIALIATFARNPKQLKIEALNDGDLIKENEPVLKITGRYEDFGYLESLIDGILARRTSVATNVYRIKKIIGNKYDMFSMADRQDDYLTQAGDGYATYVAGVKKVSTDAQGLYWGGKGMGTMPHALIQMCHGDVVKAAKLYHQTFPKEKVSALVDYNNDVITDALKLAKALNKDLGAVRVDTSKALIDKYFKNKNTKGFDPHGVCKELIFALRHELDKHGYKHVKIVVSSSFTLEKIKEWVKCKVPVNTYGVGSALVVNTTSGFTGDLVMLDGKPEAKVGRTNIKSKRLEKVKL